MNDELKDFWEWCGFKWIQKKEDMIFGPIPQYHWNLIAHWQYPDGHNHEELPALTLDNLFKWAVPKLGFVEISILSDPPKETSGVGYYVSIRSSTHQVLGHSLTWFPDPAQALYEAIQKRRKECQK